MGVELLECFPRCSQDLNPIEVVWRELRARLADTQPVAMETREEFIVRLRQAVDWVNKNRGDYFEYLCGCQKEWAQDVLEATPPGARTRH